MGFAITVGKVASDHQASLAVVATEQAALSIADPRVTPLRAGLTLGDGSTPLTVGDGSTPLHIDED